MRPFSLLQNQPNLQRQNTPYPVQNPEYPPPEYLPAQYSPTDPPPDPAYPPSTVLAAQPQPGDGNVALISYITLQD